MPAAESPKRWTVEEVREMQDESRAWPRYELVDGELLVSPGPRPLHQVAVGELFAKLYAYVDAQRIGIALTSPADIGLEPGSIVQPDVFVVPAGGPPLRDTWTVVASVLLVVEVLSPSTARYDRVRKRRFFRRVGVPEYWIVDLDARLIERSQPDHERVELLDERLTWHPTGAAEPFTLDLPAFFARVHREV